MSWKAAIVCQILYLNAVEGTRGVDKVLKNLDFLVTIDENKGIGRGLRTKRAGLLEMLEGVEA